MDRQLALANTVGDEVAGNLGVGNYHTGSERFDGEWLFGTYQMAGLGLAQIAVEHPQQRERNVRLIEQCIDQMLSPEVKAFDITAWQEDPIQSLDTGHGHAAYLGYLNCVLSYARLLDIGTRHAGLNDRITAALVRRVEAEQTLLIETYPEEVYPVDNCAVIGSIGLYDRATGADHGLLIRRWVEQCRTAYTDRTTGLLIQCVDPETGAPLDKPRGSGTCLGLYFLSFADHALSADLYRAVKASLSDTFLGFGVVREYPAGVEGSGDIDSGPIILGYGISATGFALAGARMHADEEAYRRLYSTVHLFGAPLRRDDSLQFVTGGPLGDAILLAMLTAQPSAKLVPISSTRPTTEAAP